MKKEIRVKPTFELLSEMEERQILGGDGDVVHVHALKGCNETNTYCGQAYCYCTIVPGPKPVDPVPNMPKE